MSGQPGSVRPSSRPKLKTRGKRRRTASPPTAASPRAARTRAPRRRWLRLVWAVLGVLLGLAGGLAVWATFPGPGSGKRITLRVSPEAAVGDVAGQLGNMGVLRSPRWFEAYVRFLSPGFVLAPGEHLLNDGLSARELARRLGRLPGRASTRVTIPEGFHHGQIAERLEAAEICSAASFKRAVSERRLLDRLGIAAPSAEGYLFPATYDLYVDSNAEQIVEDLVEQMRKRLQKLRAQHSAAFSDLAQRLGWGERELLTMASIIEREARAPDERRTIASVFFNRLVDPAFRPQRMLQSDPTAAYGCLIAGDSVPTCATFRGLVTAAMLRDAANPYNTYRHPGLPPGPIANPGEGAIRAALDPERTDYFYFVATGGGRHAFSRTFGEHRGVIDGHANPAQQE